MSKRIYYRKTNREETLSKQEQMDLMLDLIHAFQMPKNPHESAQLLQDILTRQEIINLSKRLRIAKLLVGNEKYRDISQQSHCSFGTIAKVADWLDRGGQGFRKIIANLPKKYEHSSDLPKGPIEFHLPQTLATYYKHKKASDQDKLLNDFNEKIIRKRATDSKLHRQLKDIYHK